MKREGAFVIMLLTAASGACGGGDSPPPRSEVASSAKVSRWTAQPAGGDTRYQAVDASGKVVTEFLARQVHRGLELEQLNPTPAGQKVLLTNHGALEGDAGPLLETIRELIRAARESSDEAKQAQADASQPEPETLEFKVSTYSECVQGHWELRWIGWNLFPVFVCDNERTCTNFDGDCTGTAVFPFQDPPNHCVQGRRTEQCTSQWMRYPWVKECDDGFVQTGVAWCVW